LVALHFLSQLQDNQIDSYLLKAMSSPILMTRLEALYMMSKRKHICALGQIEALMNHLPPELKPLFPELVAILGTKEAKSYLKTFFHDHNINVRLSSIINASLTGQDDFLPLIQQRAKHPHIAEIEACIFSFSVFNDYSSIPFIQTMAKHESSNVSLASHLALYHMGDKSQAQAIEKLATQEDIFAINALGQIEGTEKTLHELLKSHNPHVRANAGLALLEKKDPQALTVIKEFLLSNRYDKGLKPVYSLGRTQLAFEVVNSASSKKEDPVAPLALLQSVKEYVLMKCIELPEESFLKLAKELFLEEERDLFFRLTSLLESIKSPNVIHFLKEEALKGKTPIVRDWCNLALFKLHEEGPYEAYVRSWVQYQSQNELIELKEYLPWQMRLQKDSYALTAHEKSSLLMEMISALLSRKDLQSVETIVNVWMKGNEKNRYVLAGLLMRATE
jgi:HEAT repeat protein